MKSMRVPLLAHVEKEGDLKALSAMMDKLQHQVIDITSWADYAYKPGVSFAIAHTDDSVVLKYYVKEKDIQAKHNKINEAVYKDSCVEFFIAFDEGGYYNFEFNCIGNCLCGYGPAKQDREALPVAQLQRIKYQATIHRTSAQANAEWELLVVIPVDVFSIHSLSSLKGLTATANFYKCGDELPEPHYVSWTKIETAQPDFHQPKYFGELKFEK